MRQCTHRVSPVSEAVYIVAWIASDHGDEGIQQKSDHEEYFEGRQIELRYSEEANGKYIQQSGIAGVRLDTGAMAVEETRTYKAPT